MSDAQQIAEALDRIARTADGLILYRHLEKQLCAVCLDLGHGALRRHEGYRMFARELMGFMAEGIDASGGRSVLGQRDGGGGDGQRKRRQSIREYARKPAKLGRRRNRKRGRRTRRSKEINRPAKNLNTSRNRIGTRPPGRSRTTRPSPRI